MTWKRMAIVIVSVSLAGVALGAWQTRPPTTTPPPQTMPTPPPVPPQMPTVPAPPPQTVPPQMMPGQSSVAVDVYLLAALRAQDAKIAELEARIKTLEARAGVKK